MFWHSEQVLVVVFSRHFSMKPMIEQSLFTEMKVNLIALPSLWFDDMYIETIELFEKSRLRGNDQRSCSFLPSET